ncbi:MAG: signal recognition particle-docking protein FtsY [Ruminococcaceae bacterium]|nr:signal recognition particle-docking protein FtsY [Oscillospiraceae bacterium]
MAFKSKFGKFFGFGKSEAEDTVLEEKVEKAPEESIEANTAADDVELPTEEIAQADIADNEAQPFAQDTQLSDSEELSDEDAFEETTDNAEEVAEEKEEVLEEKIEEAPKKGFFAKLKAGLSKTRDSFNSKLDSVISAFKKVDEELFEELEEALIMADVGVDTSLYIIDQLRKRVKENKISEPEQVKGAIEEIIAELLCENDNSLNVSSKPAVIMVIGVNGVGKTTSIGKLASRYKQEGKNVILGAADTFRAAAIDQLQIWADRSGVEIVKHQEGSDPASVVFDTIAAAKSRGSDIIILDTAGRLHNKKNLMDELSKIARVIERELPGASVETLLVLDATTGQNAVNQAKLFSEAAAISGIILTKLDGSAKGGIVLAISHEQSIPVKLIGVGEGIDDLQNFAPEDFAKALFE